jgi:hydroxyacylglutathione hydrolase
MLLKRFYDEKLAQASYLVGCAATGEALVVDPNRDVQQYIDAARAEGLRLTHVTETHIHADYVSGTRELVSRTGARTYLSDEGGPDWSYRFADALDAVLLKEGSVITVGNVHLRAMHTPGHTPEHMSFIVTDTAGADQPMGVLTGDFVFVGDVGRPDLLERAAGVADTMEAGARALFQSLRRFRELPDWVQLWPGHGAGSACGKSLGAVPSTTLGYERLFNWAFAVDDEDAFVDAVLAGQPEPPAYFAQMKRINRDGPRIIGDFALPSRAASESLGSVLQNGGFVVDTRIWGEYRKGYVPGTINIPLNRSFTTWAGWLMPYDRDAYLIFADDDEAAIMAAVRDLAMIGLDRLAGYFTADAVRQYAASHDGELPVLGEITPAQLETLQEAGPVGVLDVRGISEWRSRRVPGVPNIPVGYLHERIEDVPEGRPLVVYCQSGSRSAIAASVLAAHGITDVLNLTGGIDAWARAGHAVESQEAVATS